MLARKIPFGKLENDHCVGHARARVLQKNVQPIKWVNKNCVIARRQTNVVHTQTSSNYTAAMGVLRIHIWYRYMVWGAKGVYFANRKNLFIFMCVGPNICSPIFLVCSKHKNFTNKSMHTRDEK